MEAGPTYRDTWRYALSGAVLSLGAPLGWMAARALGRHVRLDGWSAVVAELTAHVTLYAYLLGGSLCAFIAFGAVLGQLSNELRYANVRLVERAITDGLTGLRNRAFFEEQLGAECARGDRDDRPFALVSIDLDHFKSVNDDLGHAAGDVALAHAARIIASHKRASDVACRVGGEEFALICTGAGADEGERVAERIRAALEAHQIPYGGSVVRLTASFGVAARYPHAAMDDVLDAADRALYAAKAEGRNAVRTVASALRVATPVTRPVAASRS